MIQGHGMSSLGLHSARVCRYALKPWQMLALVARRQLRLALTQRQMNIGRAVQVCLASVSQCCVMTMHRTP